MNRKQRRAASKHAPPGRDARESAAADPVKKLYADAIRLQQQNRLNDAARAYKRLLLLKPDHAEANNNLGCVLQAQGKLSEASARFARSLALMPQMFDQFGAVSATLVALLPPLGEAMRRAAEAWPERLSREQLLGTNTLSEIAADPLFLAVLQSTPVRDIALERALTSLRRSLLDDADTGNFDDDLLVFCCVLARQCFINEYVFATTPEEDASVERLAAVLADALAANAPVVPMLPAALAMYRPLHALADAHALLGRSWPQAVANVLTQQIGEPQQERELRDTIARLTPIDDAVSQRVREQYEESPYPRWVNVAGGIEPIAIDQYLRNLFPTGAFTPLGKTDSLDVLVVGCGTGWQTSGIAQTFLGVRILAVDLSLSSLCYAKRKTPASLAGRIDYAQADILKLGALDRDFDVIDASGVLHHLADPFAGWRILNGLLRSGGLMHLGLYSELGRREVVAARAFIAERGYGSSPAEIRRSRQELAAGPLKNLLHINDFFSTSECRDLLFHVQESRVGIPAIKAFLAEQNLRFLGFEFDVAAQQHYRALFSSSGWSMTDLDRWHAYEAKFPDTFSNMYQFWVQKN